MNAIGMSSDIGGFDKDPLIRFNTRGAKNGVATQRMEGSGWLDVIMPCFENRPISRQPYTGIGSVIL